ncbi:MAG: Fe-S cluster assembly ATPase SufC [Candidatus Pacearchaeota archaeon]
MKCLEIKNLYVSIGGREIIKGVDMNLEFGKVNVLMGPNGSGKSTLANVIMGNPKYKIEKGKIFFNNININEMPTDKRAKLGIFMSFQYPQEIEGVTIANFLKTIYNSLNEEKISFMDFKKILNEKSKLLNLSRDFYERYLNHGFSGGEKKKSEMLQLLVLNPKFAILDETDSGLDIDALKSVSKGINKFMKKDKCILIITHYKRILELVNPDKVFIMLNGKIVKEGSSELPKKLEQYGYTKITK